MRYIKKDSNPIYDIDLDVQGEYSFSATIGNSKDNSSSTSITTTTRRKPHHGSVMIVDDEHDIVNVIRQSLERDGFKVCSFTNASLALEHFNSDSQHQNHQAVISDIRMRGMNGYDEDINSKVKVILMSALEIEDGGNNNRDLFAGLPDVKIDAFIQKPFSVLSLINIIDSIETL